ncbi:MAG: MBOAT family O-acyltransferase [Rikenellaceae bacterium]
MIEELVQRFLPMLSYDSTSPMLFSSGLFLVLFTLFYAIYAPLKGRYSARVWYVIAFSLYFYYKSSGLYFMLLLTVSVSDFVIGAAIHRSSSRVYKDLLLALSLAINLLLLGYFKYTNLLLDSLNSVMGDGTFQMQSIFLPVGISFFLFQSMSYTIDIYRGALTPLSRWRDYIFFLSFFPQLVAGPIVRAREFLPQIVKPHPLTREGFSSAMFLILTGLFKKCVISDYISLNFIDRIFDEPLLYTGFESLMAIYGYALQIYCDFSGYSDMAIGLAMLLGFHFSKNFDAPYKSATITEFWRRWHISLSSWLRDYLYISLGGSRRGRIRTYINLLIVMLLGGLWHGAAVRFILWGALHGVALALHKGWMEIFPSSKVLGRDMNPLQRALGVFLTFNLVSLGWLLFRAESWQSAELMLHQVFYNFNGEAAWQVIQGYASTSLLMVLGFTLHLLPSKVDSWAKGLYVKSPVVVQMLVMLFMIWLVAQVATSELQPFIYFQF